MRKIFISYGDDRFKETLKRLGKEAKALGIFDEIKLFTPSNLPIYIKASPLMAFNKGGGYWIWKPYIIYETLKKCSSDDIVIYADAGCKLQNSGEWSQYFELLKNYNALVFMYRNDVDYGWNKYFKSDSPKIKDWTKQSTIDFFTDKLQDNLWTEKNKIMATCCMFKNQHGKLINDWLSISLLRPDLIFDPFEIELINQSSNFVAHRHDQSILTPLAHHYSKYNNEVLVLSETAESQHLNAAIIAKRIRSIDKIPIKSKIRKQLRQIIGEKLSAEIRNLKKLFIS